MLFCITRWGYGTGRQTAACSFPGEWKITLLLYCIFYIHTHKLQALLMLNISIITSAPFRWKICSGKPGAWFITHPPSKNRNMDPPQIFFFCFLTISPRLESTWGISRRRIALHSPSRSFTYPGSSESQRETKGKHRGNLGGILVLKVLIVINHVRFCKSGVCMVLLRGWRRCSCGAWNKCPWIESSFGRNWANPFCSQSVSILCFVSSLYLLWMVP